MSKILVCQVYNECDIAEKKDRLSPDYDSLIDNNYTLQGVSKQLPPLQIDISQALDHLETSLRESVVLNKCTFAPKSKITLNQLRQDPTSNGIKFFFYRFICFTPSYSLYLIY